jgi:hypothetical protein
MFKSLKSKTEKYKQGNVYQLVYLILISIVIIYFWNHIVLYPFKMLIVFFHEASHALATILTGGKVQELVVVSGQGGYVISQGGSRFIILNSGYLGSLIWGTSIYSLSIRFKIGKFLMFILGIVIGLITLFFIRNLFALLFGILFTVVMILSAIYLPSGFNNFILRLIGLISMAYVPLDILTDTIYNFRLKSDAQMLADEFGGTTMMWGGSWLLMSLLFIIFTIVRSFNIKKSRDKIIGNP